MAFPQLHLGTNSCGIHNPYRKAREGKRFPSLARQACARHAHKTQTINDNSGYLAQCT